MKLGKPKWREGRGLARLLDALAAAQGRTRFVGGCVRDTLLDLPVSDIDLATQFAPQEVVQRLEAADIKAVPTGIAHGTVTAVSAGQPVEVTTLRRDVSTDGRRATVAFTEDWREDAARRDFTMNALSADPESGEIFDYFDGLADLNARRVRFIGDPLTRIAEDHLRILRFFRFHARFGAGEPDAEGLAACTARANDLMALSRERIADELIKLLALPEPAGTVAIMLERGIFRPIIPEIEEAGLQRLVRPSGREGSSSIARDPLRRFAALLPPDHVVAERVAQRLRLSKKAVKRLVSALSPDHRDVPAEQLAYWLGAASAIDHILLGDGDPTTAQRLKGWTKPTLGVSGGSLIALGVPEGPAVARTLVGIERRWVSENFPPRARLQEIVAEAVAAD